MSEAEVVSRSQAPLTVDSMREQFAALGLEAGQTVLVHCAMSQMGWIVGSAEAVIQALLMVLTPEGTLMMPTFSASNTDPANWQDPPVPESWWQTIRDHMPAYNPISTPTRQMGAIAELFRTWPGVIRSSHPTMSFAATGPNADRLISDHSLEADLSEGSPLSKLYDLDGYVMLVGVGHDNNTSLHLAEYRADWLGKTFVENGSAILVDGERQWVTYKALDGNAEDFQEIGTAFEVAHPVQVAQIGEAKVRLFKQRPLVDFAVGWMERNRVLAKR